MSKQIDVAEITGLKPDFAVERIGSRLYAFRSVSGGDADLIAERLSGRFQEPYVQERSLVPGMRMRHEYDGGMTWATLDRWNDAGAMQMLEYMREEPDFLREIKAWGIPEKGKYHLTLHMRPDPSKHAAGKRDCAD